MEFVFGMTVIDADGLEAGTLDRVLVDPNQREITHVVVRSPRVSEDVLLPLSLLQGNAGACLVLRTAAGDLENMPRYYEGRTSSPPSGRIDTGIVREPADRRVSLDAALNVPPEAREYGEDTPVMSADQAQGRLLSLATDDYTNRLSGLRVAGLLDQQAPVPDRWIAELAADAIRLAATQAQLRQPPLGPEAAQYIVQESGGSHEVTERARVGRG